MILKKRIAALVLLVVFVIAAVYYAHIGTLSSEQLENALHTPGETIHIWYTDEALTDYMNSAAVSFNKENDIRVVPVLVSGLEYLDEINRASLGKSDKEKDMPDLYVVSNDVLEKAYLAGLASPISDTENICTTQEFPKAALDAVTYKEKKIGYPFYFETSVLLYNKTYMDEVVKTAIESEADLEIAEQAQEKLNEAIEAGTMDALVDEDGNLIQADADMQADVSQEQIDEKIDTVIPKTIDDILTFADEYDAPEMVEAVFKWDVTDIFYNYFFVGNYMILGGDTGDDISKIDIKNNNTAECLKVYQNLNQFFSIDPDEVTYDSVLQDFIDGKTVFSVVTTDAIAKIEAAKAEGNFQYDYGVTKVPDINETLQSRSLSVTNAAVINGYSSKKEAANKFAKYLVKDHINDLYNQGGKVASILDVPYENEAVKATMEEYEESIPMPKMIETSNFWVQLEIAFTKIWRGEDVTEQLDYLSNQIHNN